MMSFLLLLLGMHTLHVRLLFLKDRVNCIQHNMKCKQYVAWPKHV